MIAALRQHQQRLDLPPKDCEKTDPRKVLADAVGYFQNNVSRMDYPAYRRQGLPTTSAHMESLVKEINARVKGTEKFWNDGPSGEAILQIRSAALRKDDRLHNFLYSRSGHPFHPNTPPTPFVNNRRLKAARSFTRSIPMNGFFGSSEAIAAFARNSRLNSTKMAKGARHVATPYARNGRETRPRRAAGRLANPYRIAI